MEAFGAKWYNCYLNNIAVILLWLSATIYHNNIHKPSCLKTLNQANINLDKLKLINFLSRGRKLFTYENIITNFIAMFIYTGNKNKNEKENRQI